MKSRFLFLLALLTGSVNVLAQNLVPNGSFEEGIECPSFIGNVDAQCADWFNSISYPSPNANQITPEWYHACGELDIFTPPHVAFGYQEPFDGEGYVGLVVYNNQDGVEESYREIIGVELIEPLIQGNTYLVEFSIVRLYLNVNAIATNNFGYKFTTQQQVNYDSLLVDNTASFHIDTIVSDTANWLNVSSEFIADSNYSYIHFGNFFDNENTEFIIDGDFGIYCNMALDAVSVTEVSTVNTKESSILNDLGIFPNPVLDKLYINSNSKITNYALYSSSGSEIKIVRDCNDSSIEIDMQSLSKGIYFLHLTTTKSKYYEKIIKI